MLNNTVATETAVVGADGRRAGFCLAVELGIACLRRGRALVCKTRGKLGEVRVIPAVSGRAFGVYVRRDDSLGVHELPRDAVEHFIALVGEKAAFKAIQHAASHHELADGSHDPFMVECVVSERRREAPGSVAEALGWTGKDVLSYGYFATRGNTRKWAFICRLSVDSRGGTNTGADLDFKSTLQEALVKFQEGGAT